MPLNKLKLNIFVLLLLSWLLLTSAIAATQWKWIDSEGRVNYSDKPPPLSVPKHKIVSYPEGIEFYVAASGKKSADELAAAAETKSGELTPQKNNPAKKPQATSAGVDQYNQYCTDLKNELVKYKSGVRLSRTNVDGKKEFILDEDRKRETAILEKRLKVDCDGSKKSAGASVNPS